MPALDSLIASQGVIVTAITNPFQPHTSRVSDIVSWQGAGAGLRPYIEHLWPAVSPDCDIAVSVNGRVLCDEEQAGFVISPGDSIVFCAVPHGGGGKNVFRIVALLAVAVFAPMLGPGIAALTGGNLITFAGMGVQATLAMYSAVGMIAGGMLVNAILPPSTPDVPELSSGLGSPSYSWDVTQNVQNEGAPWPVLYGTARVQPPLIGKYTEIVGDKQYLNLLYGVADHALDSISEPQINDTPLADYQGTEFEVRLGAVDQAPIKWFGDTITEVGVNRKLPIEDITDGYKTTVGATLTAGAGWAPATAGTTYGDNITTLNFSIEWPTGVYEYLSFGEMEPASYELQVRARIAGSADAWTTQSFSATDQLQYGPLAPYVDSILITGLPAGQYEFQAQLVTYTGTTTCTFRDVIESSNASSVTASTTSNAADRINVVISFPQGVYCVTDAGIEQHDVYVTAEVTPDGGDPIYQTMHVVEKKNESFRRTFHFDSVGGTTATIRVYFAKKPDRPWYAKHGIFDDCYFEYYQLVTEDDFTYPGASLLAIRALSTDQLHGQIPRVSCLAARDTVQVHNGSAWVSKAADNPAWAAYDMHVADEYGPGIPYAKMLYADFEAWADWCDDSDSFRSLDGSKDFKCNIYLDTTRSFPNALALVETLGWGRVVQKGSDFGVIMDHPGTPVQAFGVGNIVADTFSQTFMRSENRTNSVEVTYYDADHDYTRQTVTVKRQDYTEADSETMETSQVDLVGCTSRALAIYHGQFLMACNQVIKKAVTFEADIDAIACQAGDLIMVSHDVPQWGYSGRVVEADSVSVTLDRDVTLQPGTTYQVMVRHQTDVDSDGQDDFETQTVAAVAVETTTDELTLTASWTNTPAADAIYLFGETGELYEDFRVVSITRSGDMRRRITAIEYDEDIYTPDQTVSDDPSITDLTFTDNLAAREFFRWQDPSRKGYIHLTWTGQAYLWHVFYKNIDEDTEWVYAGEAANPLFKVYDLEPRTNYRFAVNHVKMATGDSAETVDFYYLGIGSNIGPILSVSGLRVKGDETGTNAWNTKDLPLVWNPANFWGLLPGDAVGAGFLPFTVSYFSRYRIQILKVATSSVLLREEIVDTPEFTYTFEMNVEDSARIGDSYANPDLYARVWGITESGQESLVPSLIRCTNPAPSAVTGLTSISKWNGVEWHWDAMGDDEPDLWFYAVRTKVTSGGTWSDYINVWTNAYRRHLTLAEILTYGRTPEIYVEVLAADFFGQLSSAADDSASANSQMDTYLDMETSADAGVTGDPDELFDGTRTSGGVTVT